MIFLRSLVFNAWFYGITVAMLLVLCLPRLLLGTLGPEQSCDIANRWARLVLGGLRLICGTRFVVTGQEHLPPDGAALIASMHQSAFDTVVWLMLVPRPCYVLKRELMAIPLFGTICRHAGMITVDRSAGAKAIRDLMRDADRAVSERRQIIIFPEGTRVAPDTVVPLQPGVAALAGRTRLPVIPIATDSGRVWGRRAFRKLPGLIHVAILPPLPADLPRADLLPTLAATFARAAAGLPGAD